MKAQLFQVDAFAERPFEGNPAAVVPLDAFPADDLMQTIAAENNLSETAFVVPDGDAYQLRWFTPAVEVPLCGHATLATAHVLFSHLGHAAPEIHFETRSGRLTVMREGDKLAMDFPTNMPKPSPMPEHIEEVLRARPLIAMKASNFLMVVFGSAAEVAALDPDMAMLKRFQLSRQGEATICTAEGEAGSGVDFVSRMFAPAKGIDEDPVTGSAHCVTVPYWAKKLGRSDLVARQISARGGTLWSSHAGDRVIMRGKCADYMKGEISF
ncbi:MAG: PhzF family phenazine biosynthesis protein [Parvibaculum sp.]